MKEREKDQRCHREDMVAVIYESEKFKRIAINQFHFIFPPISDDFWLLFFKL